MSQAVCPHRLIDSTMTRPTSSVAKTDQEECRRRGLDTSGCQDREARPGGRGAEATGAMREWNLEEEGREGVEGLGVAGWWSVVCDIFRYMSVCQCISVPWYCLENHVTSFGVVRCLKGQCR